MLKLVGIFLTIIIGVHTQQDLESILTVLYNGVNEKDSTGQQTSPVQLSTNNPAPISNLRDFPVTQDPRYEWGMWGQFSSCSVTCGVGERKRQRACYFYPERRTTGEQNNFPGALLPLLLGSNSRSSSSLLALSLLGNRGGNGGSILPNIRNGAIERQGDAILSNRPMMSSISTNPATISTRTPCPGSILNVGMCYQPDCPVLPTLQQPCLSNWVGFGKCSASCGSGIQFRTRVCNCLDSAGNPSCIEPLTESRICNNNVECVEEGRWGDWGPFSACSTTCGPGTKTRFRICSRVGKCVGNTVLTETCEIAPCATSASGASWGTWGPFGACTTTCGSGSRTRYKICVGPGTCEGSMMESTPCRNNACPTIPPGGSWGTWGPFGACTTTCGSGSRTRYKICVGPGTCEGSMMESTPCRNNACPTISSGEWGDWGPYSTCTNTCETGIKTRVRVCMGIGECRGPNMETISCRNKPCLPDSVGVWSSFGPWGECKLDTTLNQCYQQRFRSCIRERCPGPRSELRACTNGQCEMMTTTATTITTRANQAACDASFPEKRRDCGYAGISREECWQKGCCFSDVIYDVNWCFYDDFSGNMEYKETKNET
ncbi:coadhesin-like isoform X2 [Styela clava]